MNDISHAVHTALFAGVPLLIYICINELAYKEKLIRIFYKIILFGTLAISGITFIVFLSQM